MGNAVRSRLRAGRHSGVVVALGCVALLLPTVTAAASPPPNDNIADAVTITESPPEGTGTLVDATHEAGEPNHRGFGGTNSVWFKWTAPASAAMTIDKYGCHPPFDPSGPRGSMEVTVYSGAAADVTALREVAQVNGTFRTAVGQEYWIAVDAVAGLRPDSNVCFRLLLGPANDDFANATELVGFPAGGTAESSAGPATLEPGEPGYDGLRTKGSLWWGWRARDDGPVLVRRCGGEALAVYTGESVDALTPVSTRPIAGGPCQNVVVIAVSGELYKLAVTVGGASPVYGPIQVLVGNEVALLTASGKASLSYVALPGRPDHVDVQLVGAGQDRALLVKARGVDVAWGCEVAMVGLLTCPVPGREAVPLEIDLHDGNDKAQVRIAGGSIDMDLGDGDDSADVSVGGGRASVLGGRGEDTLAGRSGDYHPREPPLLGGYRDSDPLLGSATRLIGGPGDDRLLGGGSADGLSGGPGADTLLGGPGDDVVRGGGGTDDIDAGVGRDRVWGGRGNDRVSVGDGRLDVARCGAGRDRARLDGLDVSRSCDHRVLRGRARAVALWANLTESDHNLDVLITCPADVRGGCTTAVRLGIQRGRAITRKLTVDRGRSRILQVWTLSDGESNWVARHGMRVTVRTHSRGSRPLTFTRHLPVVDSRYFGE